MLKQYLSNDGDYIQFNGDYLEIYIPQMYADSGLYEQHGSNAYTFGLCNARVFMKDKPMKVETLNLPTMVTFFPAEIEDRNMSLFVDGEPEPYIILKFYKGNKMTKNTVTKDSLNIELFLNLLIKGKLPRTIKYGDVLSIWKKNMEINGKDLGVPSAIYEVIIAECYRDANDLSSRFSKKIGSEPNVGEFAYKTANIREICARNSTFSAVTFEDVDAMLVNSINNKRYDRKESQSPIEKIIKM